MRKHFEVGETAVTILAEEAHIGVAETSIFRSREIIQRFIRHDPLFQATLEPYPCPDDAPELIARMCRASALAGVGPMAAVAGAIAERAVLDMRAAGATQAIVDNGGDLALLLDREIEVGLYAGERIQGIGFACPPREGVFGICTSSATIGPSISFGASDAATVIAADVTLADACATRLGNLLTSDEEEIMRSALDDVCSIPGVEGALAVVGDRLAMKGRLPRLTRTEVPAGRIARIELPRRPG
ncbi:MAG: UPF0280 family protein [Methanomassiliicoccus sp.]|nr:UPF0280 family protein [Methanomassiliicoccus sp.]